MIPVKKNGRAAPSGFPESGDGCRRRLSQFLWPHRKKQVERRKGTNMWESTHHKEELRTRLLEGLRGNQLSFSAGVISNRSHQKRMNKGLMPPSPHKNAKHLSTQRSFSQDIIDATRVVVLYNKFCFHYSSSPPHSPISRDYILKR